LRDPSVRDALWCAFSRLIITKQAGASLAMDLSHSRPHRKFRYAPTKPFTKFLSAVDYILANSLDATERKRGPAPSIREGDARQLPLRSECIDLVLTSPPYLNAIDYMRCSKFTLVWMDYRIDELGALRGASVGAESRGSDEYVKDKCIQKVIKALDLKPKLKAREYAILARYIFDMKATMREIKRVLVPNGRAVFVVGENTVRGTYIRTSRILAELAKQLGLRFLTKKVRLLPANRRYLPPPARRNQHALGKRMRRELVLSFRKPGR
jgi:hypothetical protein